MELLKKYNTIKFTILGISIVLLVSFIILNKEQSFKDSVPEVVTTKTTSAIESLSDCYMFPIDVMQVKVLDSLMKENSSVKYADVNNTDISDYYSTRKVELLSDSINGLKKGMKIDLRQMATLTNKNQIMKSEGVTILQKDKKYSVMVVPGSDNQGQVILSSDYALREYSSPKSKSVGDITTLVHGLYKDGTLTSEQIKKIALAYSEESKFDSSAVMHTKKFIGLSGQEENFEYYYSASEDETKFSYNNKRYAIQGNIMNVDSDLDNQKVTISQT